MCSFYARLKNVNRVQYILKHTSIKIVAKDQVVNVKLGNKLYFIG